MEVKKKKASHPSLHLSLCFRLTSFGIDVKFYHRHRCAQVLSIKSNHGEAGAGPGSDEEDEGGRHRDSQGPHKGLFLASTSSEVL